MKKSRAGFLRRGRNVDKIQKLADYIDQSHRTSLLLSLESEAAKKYYDYNNVRKTRMGSDGVMLSPCVEVLTDASAKILPEPFSISAMSCAALMIRMGLEECRSKNMKQCFTIVSREFCRYFSPMQL